MEKKQPKVNDNERTKEDPQDIKEVLQEDEKEELATKVTLLEDGQVMIEEDLYGIVKNYRDGFDVKELSKRYSDVLSRYDYIVGDWGFEQLRLKGFFDNDNKKAYPDQKISSLQDYIYEYCNFGCRYFVLERVFKKKEKNIPNKRRRKPRRQEAFIAEEIKPAKKGKPVIHRKKVEEKVVNSTKKTTTEKSGSFNIRKRED